MVRVYLPNDSKSSIGGGWTFRNNLISGSSLVDGFEIVDSLDESNVSLIAGSTMIIRDTFKLIKDHGPVVLRLDGFPEDWRNRGTGYSRMRDFYLGSDGVIVQSDYVDLSTLSYLQKMTGVRKPYRKIYNGVDTKVFRPVGECYDFGGKKTFLYIGSRKDPNKRFEEVIERYRREYVSGATILLIAGTVPTEYREYGFGFYDMNEGEDWQYLGLIHSPVEMAKIMRSVDEFWFPSFADPCPNVLIEALSCEVPVRLINPHGGQKEIYNNFQTIDWSLGRMARQYAEFLKTYVK